MTSSRSTRRRHTVTAALAALALLPMTVAVAGFGPPSAEADGGDRAGRGSIDMILVNGRVSTLDARNTVVSAVAIDDGEIVRTGSDAAIRALAGRGTEVVNLRGRRVVPGLIDGHMHALRTGYHCWTQTVRLDQVLTREKALTTYAAKAEELPDGAWMWTTSGGWNLAQLDDPAPFTLTELSEAAPDNPVWVTGTGITGARVNQAALDALGLEPGDPGVEVDESGDATGGISGPANTAAGQAILAQLDQLGVEGEAGCLADFMQDAARYGLTSIKDAGGNNAPWKTTGAISDGLHGEEPASYLYRNSGFPVRIAFHQMSGYLGPAAAQENLDNAVGYLGDDWFRYLGPGEDTMATDAGYADFTTLAARKRVSVETHVGNIDAILDGFEAADGVAPIDDLGWRIAHPEDGAPSDTQISRAQALDAGWILTFSTVRNGAPGPRYRSVLQSGSKFCLASDAMNVAPWQPFQNLWYVVSGDTLVPGVSGVPEEQQLTRLQALRHQTVDCAWSTDQEGEVGSLERGNFADLLVLNKDYFKVPEDEIRTVKPVLTIAGGDVTYAGGAYSRLD